MKPSREASKQETRDALIAAGLAEFAEKGLDAPSLDAICARAGFTRGAFYVHFRDRNDFLVAVMDHVFRLFLDAIIAREDDATGLEQTIDRFATAVALAPAADRAPVAGIALHRVLDACGRSPELRARFVSLVTGGFARVGTATDAGQRAGTVRADVAPDALGQMLGLLALGVLTAVDLGVSVDTDTTRETVRKLVAAKRS